MEKNKLVDLVSTKISSLINKIKNNDLKASKEDLPMSDKVEVKPEIKEEVKIVAPEVKVASEVVPVVETPAVEVPAVVVPVVEIPAVVVPVVEPVPEVKAANKDDVASILKRLNAYEYMQLEDAINKKAKNDVVEGMVLYVLVKAGHLKKRINLKYYLVIQLK